MLPKATSTDDVLRATAIVNPMRFHEPAYNQPMADTNARVDLAAEGVETKPDVDRQEAEAYPQAEQGLA